MHSVVKTPSAWRSSTSISCRCGSDLVRRHAGEHERAPRDPQRDADRRLVGPVPADVADHGVHGAVRHLDRVVEVAAEQRPAATGR